MHYYFKVVVSGSIAIILIFFLLRYASVTFLDKISPDVRVDGGLTTSGDTTFSIDTPYFDLFSLNKVKVNRFDVLGTPTVITFWSTWSSDSIDQIKILDDYLYKSENSAKGAPVRILAIDSQENKITVANLIDRGDYSLEVLLDTTGEVTNLFKVETLPTTFFVNKDGKIIEVFVGTLSEGMLVDKMEKILN